MTNGVTNPNKTIFRVILAAAAVLILCGAFCGAAAAHEDHNGITFQSWDDTTKLPSSGSYYLNVDVTLGDHTGLTGDLNLCLNGHVVKITCENRSIILVENGHTLNLYDCNSENKVHYFTVFKDNRGWILDDTKTGGTAIDAITSYTQLTKDKVIKVTGGVITGGREDDGGGAIYINGAGSTCNLYGGNIIGNQAEGGGVYVHSSGTFNMNGGYIAGNAERYDLSYGGGVFVSAGSFTMSGGKIIGNYACNGGGVYVHSSGGTFTMMGGSITGNTAVDGGGVFIDGSATFNMYSGTITGNSAYDGGGIYVYGTAPVNLMGGEPVIRDNTRVRENTKEKTTVVSENNIRLYNSDSIRLNGQLTGNADVRITEPYPKEGTIFGSVGTGGGGAEHIKSDGGGLCCAVTDTGRLIWSAGASHMHDGVTFQPWADGGNLPASGSYYLETDVLLTKSCTLNGDLNLCLNGHVIRMHGEETVIQVNGGYTLNIYNSDSENKVHYFTVSKSHNLWNLDDTKTGGTGIGSITSYTQLTKGTVIKVTGGVITGSTENGRGGGIWLNNNNCVCNLYGGNIIGNSAEQGGGVFIYSGTFNMYSGYIAGNVAREKYGGGGVFVDGTSAKFTMTGGHIVGNLAMDDGGGVYVRKGGTFTMKGGDITGNSANEEYYDQGDEVASNGGGVYLDDSNSTFVMDGGTIKGNCAGADGGGVEIYDGATFTMNSGTITSNDGILGGGVDISHGATFIMNGGSITSNSVKPDSSPYVLSNLGGGVDVYESTFTMNGGTISKNTAEDGAGAYIYSGTFTMNGGSIAENKASGDGGGGGGVYMYHGTFTMNDGTISKNTAEYGAGVYLESYTFAMNDGTIAENKASGYGGGVNIRYGTFTMKGGDIIGNSAKQGGGVRVYNGTFTMENGTIANNTATESGGGVLLNKSMSHGYYDGIGKLTLSGGNPVIRDNTADNIRFTETDLFTLAGSLGDNAEVRITSPDAQQYASFGTVSGTPNGAEHIILDGKNFKGAVNGSSLIWGDVSLHEHDGITFVPWTSSTKLPTSGNYHLVCDVTITSHCALSGDLNLCLNGYVIRMNGKQSTFLVENGHTMHLYDCNSENKVHYFTVSETNGVWNRDDSKTEGAIVFEDITSTAALTKGKVIKVTGGCITGSTEDGSGGGVYVNGGTFIMHQGNIIGNKPESGGGVYVRAGSFTMKSGSIAGNVATKSDGGGVYVSDNGKFVMDSGLIIGNSAKSNGGGVLVYNSAGTFTMNGGSIRANHANHGGGVWNGGEFLIPASTSLDVSSITGNSATSGGGVFVSGSGSSFTMYGGTITYNAAACYGGGVYFNGGTFDLMNGIIIRNSTNGADNDSDGGGVYVNGGMFKLSGGITNIKENTKNGEANNVQLTGGTLRLAGSLRDGADIRITGPEPVPGAVFGSAPYSPTGGAPTGAIYIQSDDETMFGRVEGSSLVWEKIDVPVAKISNEREFTTVQEAVDAAEAGSSDTVTLLRNAVSDETVTVRGNVTLDLAGHTIRNIGNGPVINITIGGNLTLKDSGSVIGSRTGKITGGQGVMGGGVYVAGTFTMEGGTITKNRAEDGSGVYVANEGTFTMAGGTITGNTATKSDGGGVYVKEGGTVILSGGTPVIKDNLYGKGASNLRLTGTGQLQLTGTLTSGADIRITSPSPVYGEPFGTASETAGGANLIKSDGGDLFGTVSGSSSLIWTREGSTSVAKINNREFLTVQAAFNAAASGDTVTLLTDAASDETVTLAGKKITLDLAGHALSLSGTGSGPVITVKSNGPEFCGILTLKDSTGGGKITGGHGTTGGGVYVGEDSIFTVESGSITQNTASVAGGGVYAAEGGTFEMEGGTITGNSAPAGGGAYIDNGMFYLRGGTPVVSGNTDAGGTGESPLVNNLWLTGPDQFDLTGVLGEGADIRIASPSPVLNDRFGTASETAGGAEKITPDDGSFRGLIRDGMLIWDGAPVAKISSGTEFSSVQAAVNAASSGDTVTLLTNAKSGDTITISKKEITLDLSGYVLSTTGSKPVITIGTLGILTVTDSNPDEKHYFTKGSGLYVYAGDEQTGGLTEVTGGCITGGSSVNGGGVSISDGGTLTLAGGNIIGNSASDAGGGVYAGGLYVGSSFVMTGGNIIGNSAKSNGGGVYVAGGSSFVMKGGSITENTGEWCCGGVYVYSGTFTMNGGSITKNNGGTYGGGVDVSYGKFIISGGNPVIKENTRGTGNQAYAANVQLSATNQLELTGALGESAEIYVTSPDAVPGSVFGTASGNAGGAKHIKSDTLKDTKGNPVSGIIFNTLLMWDDTEEKTDIGFGSSRSVNAPVSNDLQSAPPNDTGDLTADLRSLGYMVESVTLHGVDTANPGRYKLNYKASSALWDEFNLPMMMESSLYVKPFKLEITCDGEPFDARLTVTFKVDKENVKKVITERKDVMLGHLNGNNKWELIKADMVTPVSEGDQYLHFSVTAQEPTAFFAAAVLEKPVTIPVDNGTAEFEDDGDIKVLSSGRDAASDVQLTRVTNLTNGFEVQLRESNSNPVAVTILENHLEKLLQDDPSLDSQIISVFGVRVMDSTGSEVPTGGVLTLKVVLKDGYSPEYVRFYHFETRAWTLLSSEYLGGNEYSIPTRSFSPFAVVYAEPKEKPTPVPPTPVPASSSSQQGSSTWLTETPTPTPAPMPTPAPTGTPAPEMPQVKPLETKQAASPAPFMGVLAGLGCAAVVFGLRRK